MGDASSSETKKIACLKSLQNSFGCDDSHKNARAVIIDKVGGVGWVLTRLIGSLTVDH